MKEKDQEFKPWASKSVLDSMSMPKKKDALMSAYEQWRKNPEAAATENLLKELDPIITGAIRSYAGNDLNLKPKASMIALDALKKYDPTKQIKINTYVYNYLQGLHRISNERASPVHIPEGVLLDRNKLNKKEAELEDKLGRAPTVAELADYTGLSIKRIEAVRKGNTYVPESQLLTEKGDSLFTNQGDSDKIWVDYVYHDLDPVDKKIFEWTTGYGGAPRLKKKEIAEKLKLSAPAVSLRINKIVSKLEQGYDI